MTRCEVNSWIWSVIIDTNYNLRRCAGCPPDSCDLNKTNRYCTAT